MARETPVRRAFVSAAKTVGEAFRVRPEERAFEAKFSAQQAQLDRPLTGRERDVFELLVDDGLRRNPRTAKLPDTERDALRKRIVEGTTLREFITIRETLGAISGAEAKFAAIEERATRTKAAQLTVGEIRQKAIERNRTSSLSKAKAILGTRAGEDIDPTILSAFEVLGAVDSTARLGPQNPWPEIAAFIARLRALPDTPDGQRRAASAIDAALRAPQAAIEENFKDEAADFRIILRGLATPELRTKTLGFFGKVRQEVP